jgi:hypothetical protein
MTLEAATRPELGHCAFCDREIDITVVTAGPLLVPLGDCLSCRRSTLWQAVDTTGVLVGA